MTRPAAGHGGRAVGRRAGAALLAVLAAGCAGRAVAPAVDRSCPAAAQRTALEAVCAPDTALTSLRARFRASVVAGEKRRDAEGVLVMQRPGSLRIKLFALAGFTVYDAIWARQGDDVIGWVSLPLADRDTRVRLAPGAPIEDPEVGLSLALWSLWQPRCAVPPVSDPSAPDRFAIDPASAAATARSVTVEAGEVREEVLIPGGGLGVAGGRVIARYADPGCSLAVPLARRISLTAPEQGWTADVRILEVEENPALDPRLFAPPRAEGERAPG